jgi:hypothetical protein
MRTISPRSSFRARLKTERRGMRLRRAVLLGWFYRGKDLITMTSNSNWSWSWKLSGYWKRVNMIFNPQILRKRRSVEQTRGAVTYGKMSAAWNCCKEERYLLLLILWSKKGQGRGYSITTGRGSHYTSRGCWY